MILTDIWQKLLFMSALVCTLSACDIRKKGGLDLEEDRQFGSMTIRWQVYPIGWWPDERAYTWWCRSPKTQHMQRDLKMLERSRLSMEEDGWLPFGGTLVDFDYKTKGRFADPRIPWERVVKIDDMFLYIDMGLPTQVITFNGCGSLVHIWSKGGYGTEDRYGQRLIKEDEWQWTMVEPNEKLSPRFFVRHAVEPFGRGKRYCFTLNPLHLAIRDKAYEICTEDQGQQWFTRIDGVERKPDVSVSKNNEASDAVKQPGKVRPNTP